MINLPLEKERLTCMEKDGALEEMLALASQYAGQQAWMLWEAPSRVNFIPFESRLPPDAVECSQIIVFSPAAEIWLEKPPFSGEGRIRIIRQDREGEIECFRQQQSYLLRPDCGGGRLLYEAYFQSEISSQRNTGFLRFKFGRLAGVEK